jgi:hypothetical protein
MTNDICKCCGNELWGEPNILLETKEAMDRFLNEIPPLTIGRPMFVMVIGDNGTGVVRGLGFNVPDSETNEIFVTYLKEVLRMYSCQPTKK